MRRCTGARSRRSTDGDDSNPTKSPLSAFARKPAFVKIDEVWNALNVIAIGDSHLFFSLFEPRRDRIAPSKLRCKSVPDKEVTVVQAPSFFEAPYQNFFFRLAQRHTLNHITMMHALKMAVHTISILRRT